MQNYLVLIAAFAVFTAYGVSATPAGPGEGVYDSTDAELEHLTSLLGEPNTSGCSATAPGTTSCYNGPAETASLTLPPDNRPFPGHIRGHSALGSTSVSHGVTLPMTGYTGTIESKLSHHQGARVFRCNFSGGVFLGCMPGSGSFPAEGAPFAHTCASYNLGTTTPGGSGTWRCTLTHAPIV